MADQYDQLNQGAPQQGQAHQGGFAPQGTYQGYLPPVQHQQGGQQGGQQDYQQGGQDFQQGPPAGFPAGFPGPYGHPGFGAFPPAQFGRPGFPGPRGASPKRSPGKVVSMRRVWPPTENPEQDTTMINDIWGQIGQQAPPAEFQAQFNQPLPQGYPGFPPQGYPGFPPQGFSGFPPQGQHSQQQGQDQQGQDQQGQDQQGQQGGQYQQASQYPPQFGAFPPAPFGQPGFSPSRMYPGGSPFMRPGSPFGAARLGGPIGARFPGVLPPSAAHPLSPARRLGGLGGLGGPIGGPVGFPGAFGGFGAASRFGAPLGGALPPSTYGSFGAPLGALSYGNTYSSFGGYSRAPVSYAGPQGWSQAGFPPAQGGFPPAQGGFSQQQGGFSQQQGGFQPQQAAPQTQGSQHAANPYTGGSQHGAQPAQPSY